MSFVKHAIFVGTDAPNLRDYQNLTRYILNNFDKNKVLISKGIVDELDHCSVEELVGGKVGVDVTNEKWKMENEKCKMENGELEDYKFEILDDNNLLEKMRSLDENIEQIRQYFTDTKNPVCVVKFKKTKPAKEIFEKIKSLKNHLKIVIFIDTDDIDNLYMLVWRVTNNIDGLRDVWIDEIVGIDGSNKNQLDGFDREWPPDVDVDENVIKKLFDLGLIEGISQEELIKYQIIKSK